MDISRAILEKMAEHMGIQKQLQHPVMSSIRLFVFLVLPPKIPPLLFVTRFSDSKNLLDPITIELIFASIFPLGGRLVSSAPVPTSGQEKPPRKAALSLLMVLFQQRLAPWRCRRNHIPFTL